MQDFKDLITKKKMCLDLISLLVFSFDRAKKSCYSALTSKANVFMSLKRLTNHFSSPPACHFSGEIIVMTVLIGALLIEFQSLCRF